ncbi:centromere DNA-binding protein complex CBF3 subunit [Hirsutella rhossiliensis]|uniref:Centromere DNA-binding protein complex CBF3 subunit n=1 Tax=Hirsutella rhossiliensis TaxID=111463 RepID=A0A9P8MYX8_9HYPO|nr:centromere DNA-binding protein complex CBF3 subunit [Hirsutella rhossiliensis]KAH0964588.1 centromere DNA-binding protein complex CBF3 subunit [Hirsutella rhossiliensis]
MAADDSYTAADERARAARRAGIQAKKDEQPANTARSYAAKQREWKAWCHTPRAAADGSLYSWPDGELVTPDKLAAWLKEDILLRRVVPPQKKKPRARGKVRGDGNGEAVQVRQQREQEQLEAAAMAEAESLAEALEVPLAEAAELLADDREGYVPPTGLATAAVDLTEGSLLTRGTIDAYIAAVIELWRLQVAHGNSNTENPGARHRGSDGIQAGYLPDEWLRIQDLLLTGAAYTPQNLRTRVDLLFGHYYLLRGENRRKMELADLSLLDYPPSEGPTPCGCLVSLLRDGKLNKTARKEFMGALRHKDPLFCTQGALAQLFFWRWHVAGEPPPSFRRRQDWYRIKVLVGRDREQELSYPTQLQETWRIFGAAGLIASKKTHLPRRVGAQDAETHGTSLAQISQAGRWNQSVLCQAYLTHLPRQFMRIVAGFSASRGLLPRAWEPRFEARARRQCWAEGGLDDDDLAADGFLKLMRRLRIVLLQDLAVLQLRYPSLPFFAYAPFSGPEWDEFAVAVRSTAVGAMETVSLLVRRALPELSGVIESTREALLQNSQRLAIRLEARLDGIQGGLDALLQGKVPITFTGYFGAGSAEALAPAPARRRQQYLP